MVSKFMKELHNRYMDSKCSSKAYDSVREMWKSGLLTEEEMTWFASKCGSYIYDYEEGRVYEIMDDGSMEFASKLV